MAAPEWEYTKRTWQSVGQPEKGSVQTKIVGPGLAEIKPHTPSGITNGLKQLGNRAKDARYQNREMWLITYKAYDQSGRPKSEHTATRLRVLAASVVAGRLASRWYDLGFLTLKDKIDHPRVDEPGFFGMAVEKPVYDHFRKHLPAARTLEPGTGGAATGPDVLWKELAELYAELARELRDPYYAELASELAELAYGGR